MRIITIAFSLFLLSGCGVRHSSEYEPGCESIKYAACISGMTVADEVELDRIMAHAPQGVLYDTTIDFADSPYWHVDYELERFQGGRHGLLEGIETLKNIKIDCEVK